MRAGAPALAADLDVPAALRIAEDSGGQAARVLGSLLGLWYRPVVTGPAVTGRGDHRADSTVLTAAPGGG